MIRSFFLFFLVLILLCNGSCRPKNDGEKLAKQYCGSCHVFPDPSLLDKATWKTTVLPEMAFRMGLDNQKLFNVPNQDMEKVLTTLPKAPLVSKEEWQAIQAYFLKNAPDSLNIPKKAATDSISQFSVYTKSFPFFSIPFITTLKIDPQEKIIYVGDKRSVIYKLDNAFNLKGYTEIKSPPTHLTINQDKSLTVSMVGILWPNDQERGAMAEVDPLTHKVDVFIDSIQRPVNFAKVDLNNNGLEDLVVCAFGNYTGQLLAFEKKDSSYIKHIITPLPGARNVIVKDIDHDGLKDILVLMSQAREKISLFLNKGNFKFEEKILLAFPPVYGSSYFEIADFNDDGNFDILYTNGDNADYSVTLKPYHGVRIYLNDGDLNFKESWFYPMFGASQARSADFDQDGDLDIMAISFFPAYKDYPEESVIYFENKGNNVFQPQTTFKAKVGRWLTMETGDFDHDGDEDVLLGAFDLLAGKEKGMSKDWGNNPASILVFENKLISSSALP